ncbi:MAG: hypothetical protein NT067_06075 [Candidatus Diapherotrites archaeon]|nr:hypothetical protein [Candidatus Diapherotrites archaeon]
MKFLITRPEFDDATLYLSEFSKKIIDFAKGKGFQVLDCVHAKANKKQVSRWLSEKKPELVMFNGHASDEFITGHKYEPIIRLEDAGLIEDKIVYARACNCGKTLGKLFDNKKIGAFIGYERRFRFWINPSFTHSPQDDPCCAQVLDASNQIALALLKGVTAQEAHQRGITAYNKIIENLERSDAPQELRFILPSINWNATYQVCYGNQNACL